MERSRHEATATPLEFPVTYMAVALVVEVALATKLAYLVLQHWASIKKSLKSIANQLSQELKLARCRSHKPNPRQMLLQNETRKLRWFIGRRIVWANTLTLVAFVGLIQTLAVLQEPIIESLQLLAYVSVIHLVWIALAFLFPGVTKSGLWYVLNSAVLLPYLLILPQNGSPVVASFRPVPLAVFGLFRLPAVLLATRFSVVMLCNLVHIVVVIIHMVMMNGGIISSRVYATTATEFLLLLVLAAAAATFQLFLTRRAELDVEEGSTKSKLNAASSLLQLTCDAVVELDDDLRLAQHSRELAAMLLRDSGDLSTLEGVPFTDLMPRNDAAHAVIQLMDFRSSAGVDSSLSPPQHPPDGTGAHVFHTRLVDSCSTKLQTEVFQVMYTKKNGQICHLVGLRDFTDTKPYAGLPPRRVLSEPTPSSSAMDLEVFPSGLRDKPESAHGASHTGGMMYLDIDVEQLFVKAASASLSGFVGAAVKSIFPAPHTTQLLERMHSEGVLSLERGEPLPRRVFSYEDLPVRLGSACVGNICGTMQMIQTETGVHVLMAFQAPGQRSGSSARSSRSIRESGRSPRQHGSPARSHARSFDQAGLRTGFSL